MFSAVWSDNAALFERLMEIHSNPPIHVYYTRAVYTGIKNREFFSHSGFSLEVARQLPLNTANNPNRKTHLRSVVF